MLVLVCNVGSTSLKYRLLDLREETEVCNGRMERVGTPPTRFSHQGPGLEFKNREIEAPDHAAAVQEMLLALQGGPEPALPDLEDLGGVGFKVVHAGPVSGARLLTSDVLEAMEKFSSISPAHNPPYLAAIRIFQRLLPETPLVGAFETAFHQTMPPEAYLYGVPYRWYEQYGIRRYGFHGASHRWVSERTQAILGHTPRLVSCHLGGSASLCAIRQGESVDTSMGFSLQAGVQHSNRPGDLDAFIVPYLVDQEGYTWDQALGEVTSEGGMLGLSGVSGDMREIEDAAREGDERAQTALDVFSYGVKKYIGAYAAALGGLDAVAFTGGIGENGVEMRQWILEGLEFLGVHLDPEANRLRGQEVVISRADSPVQVLVIPANEELVVARQTREVIEQNRG